MPYCVGQDVSLLIVGETDMPILAYYDGSNGNLKFARLGF